MDLPNRILTAFAPYHLTCDYLARVRQAIYDQPGSTEGARDAVDATIINYLLIDVEHVLPPEATGESTLINNLPHREALLDHLEQRGYIATPDTVTGALIGWAAAQVYGHWQELPWKKLCEAVFDEQD